MTSWVEDLFPLWLPPLKDYNPKAAGNPRMASHKLLSSKQAEA
jgi:hypothetical protein